jgi:hypothetical protein
MWPHSWKRVKRWRLHGGPAKALGEQRRQVVQQQLAQLPGIREDLVGQAALGPDLVKHPAQARFMAETGRLRYSSRGIRADRRNSSSRPEMVISAPVHP